MERDTYKLIRADGTQKIYKGKPTIADIARIIGCETLDTVTLDGKRRTVMFVDDTGMIDGEPVNAEATARYRAICKPGTLNQIHGSVVIVNDGDY